MRPSSGARHRITAEHLRDNLSSLLERAGEGEEFTVLMDGREVAILGPPDRRPHWLPRAEFASRVAAHKADPALRREIRTLLGEDDLS